MRGFDYVIVGGGSAGCALAARLSEDPAAEVLLLEAGGANTGMLVRMPAGVGQPTLLMDGLTVGGTAA